MKRSAYVYGLFIICLIWLSSCAASRNIDTQRQVDYRDDFLQIQHAIESLKVDFSKQTKITTDKLSNLKVENKTVYLSAPDSTGKQHPVKESITTATQDEQERQQVDETIALTMQQFSARLDSISNKIDALINEKQQVVELSWWDLHKDAVYACIIGLLLVALLIYRLKR